MIAVLTVSIAVAFAAVTFLPTTEDAAAPRSTPSTTAGPTSVTDRPAVALASTVPTTVARPTTSVGPPTPAGAATTVAVVPTSAVEPVPTAEPAPAARAAADLASYYVALAAGDRLGAFDHFAADLQAQVGGFDRFDALWSATATVRATAAECAAPDDGGVVACRSVVEVDGIGGACTRANAVTDLALIGTRYRIIGQALEPGVPCAS
jgi:hypothetical protein